MDALLSVLGLYELNPDLFSEMVLPPSLNRETLINNLVMDLAEINTIISDSRVMQLAIKYWSASRVDVWQHLYETTQYDYNPIWNKDGHFYEKETRDLAGSLSGSSTTDDTRTDKRSAYDSTAFQNVEQSTLDSDSTVSNNSTDTGTVERERTEQGNIGLTSTQQLIKEEREIAEFNLYSFIIDEFKQRFCILVY